MLKRVYACHTPKRSGFFNLKNLENSSLNFLWSSKEERNVNILRWKFPDFIPYAYHAILARIVIATRKIQLSSCRPIFHEFWTQFPLKKKQRSYVLQPYCKPAQVWVFQFYIWAHRCKSWSSGLFHAFFLHFLMSFLYFDLVSEKVEH